MVWFNFALDLYYILQLNHNTNMFRIILEKATDLFQYKKILIHCLSKIFYAYVNL